MGASSDDSSAGPDHRTPQLAELSDGIGRTNMNTGDQLDLARMQLPLDLALHVPEPSKHCLRRIRLMTGHWVDEEQLLLDAERKRPPRTEMVFELLSEGHDPQYAWDRRGRPVGSWTHGEGCVSQRKESAVMRLTSVTTSAGIPARLAAAMIASGLGAS